MERYIKFTVVNIFCGNCVYRVRKALQTLPAVRSVEIIPDYDKGIAKVVLIADRNIDKDEINEVLLEISQETPYHEYKAIWEE